MPPPQRGPRLWTKLVALLRFVLQYIARLPYYLTVETATTSGTTTGDNNDDDRNQQQQDQQVGFELLQYMKIINARLERTVDSTQQRDIVDCRDKLKSERARDHHDNLNVDDKHLKYLQTISKRYPTYDSELSKQLEIYQQLLRYKGLNCQNHKHEYDDTKADEDDVIINSSHRQNNQNINLNYNISVDKNANESNANVGKLESQKQHRRTVQNPSNLLQLKQPEAEEDHKDEDELRHSHDNSNDSFESSSHKKMVSSDSPSNRSGSRNSPFGAMKVPCHSASIVSIRNTSSSSHSSNSSGSSSSTTTASNTTRLQIPNPLTNRDNDNAKTTSGCSTIGLGARSAIAHCSRDNKAPLAKASGYRAPHNRPAVATSSASPATNPNNLDNSSDNYESASESHDIGVNRQYNSSNNRVLTNNQNNDSNDRLAPNTSNRMHASSARQLNNNNSNADRNGSSNSSNLSRARQQRASLSSVSSSDSYGSYGSGYASGSGNSTDHDNKHRVLREIEARRVADQGEGPCQDNDEGEEGQTSEQTTPSPPTGSSSSAMQNLYEDDHEGQDCDEDRKRQLQLKQHLSELEQLTDELASHNLFCNIDGTQGVSKNLSSKSTHQEFSSATIKSTGSSVISSSDCGSSNLSSLNEHPDPCENIRSTSTTPTAANIGAVHLAPSMALSTSQATRRPPVSRAHTIPAPHKHMSIKLQNKSGQNSSSNSSTATSSETTSPEKSGRIDAQEYDEVDGGTPKMVRSSAAITLNKVNPSVTVASTTILTSSPPRTNTTTTKLNASTSIVSSSPPSSQHLHWDQIVSKGCTRPLLINDLDFTDLRDEDDCDLLNGHMNSNNQQPQRCHTMNPSSLKLELDKLGKPCAGDQTDSGAASGVNSALNSPNAEDASTMTGSSMSLAPPPMPPPPMSPWYSTMGSRPQSQLLALSPTVSATPTLGGDASPVGPELGAIDGNYQPSTIGGRSSVCVGTPQTSTPSRLANGPQQSQFASAIAVHASNLRSASSMSSLLFGSNGRLLAGNGANKRKKTMKLFWKEVREDRSLLAKLTKKRTIWDEIKPIDIDTQKLEYLFESKAKDLSLSRSRSGLDGLGQRKAKITVLDAKRSNAINIGMTKLPPMRTIKSAILKMDSSIMNREGIEKILTTMMPTEEEKSRIVEAQLANPDTPLGTAEQFLLNLASISALEARLKLWAFQLDYAQIEKEVAEPLMDLKQAIEEIEQSETFRLILGTLLAIGNFLNCSQAKGFQIDYLEKVPEVKDTVHKHSLLHHLCLFIQERHDPELSRDLYSEFSAVNRASKVDYAELGKQLKKMQQDCKASCEYLKVVSKHDGLSLLMSSSANSSTSGGSSCVAAAASGLANQSTGSNDSGSGKLNNLGDSKISFLNDSANLDTSCEQQPSAQQPQGRLVTKTRMNEFLTDCGERIVVLMVIHRRVMNRFQKLLVYLGCPSHQIKQAQPQQILRLINEFALEYRTKRERVRELLHKRQQQLMCRHGGRPWTGGQPPPSLRGGPQCRWAGSTQSVVVGDRPASMMATASGGLRCCNSPSNMSQLSNYSDYNGLDSSASHHATVNGSMYDLSESHNEEQTNTCNHVNTQHQIHQDEQLRRLLGAGKSFDGACQDLFRMSHWNSTEARARRPSGPQRTRKTSTDDQGASQQQQLQLSQRRQSSFYARGANHNSNSFDAHDMGENSDEELLHCLVRTSQGQNQRKSSSHGQNHSLNQSSVSVRQNQLSTLSSSFEQQQLNKSSV